MIEENEVNNEVKAVIGERCRMIPDKRRETERRSLKIHERMDEK